MTREDPEKATGAASASSLRDSTLEAPQFIYLSIYLSIYLLFINLFIKFKFHLPYRKGKPQITQDWSQLHGCCELAFWSQSSFVNKSFSLWSTICEPRWMNVGFALPSFPTRCSGLHVRVRRLGRTSRIAWWCNTAGHIFSPVGTTDCLTIPSPLTAFHHVACNERFRHSVLSECAFHSCAHSLIFLSFFCSIFLSVHFFFGHKDSFHMLFCPVIHQLWKTVSFWQMPSIFKDWMWIFFLCLFQSVLFLCAEMSYILVTGKPCQGWLLHYFLKRIWNFVSTILGGPNTRSWWST